MEQFRFRATIIHWRGPAPHFFVPIPPEHVEKLRQAARAVSYGWGMIPVRAAIGGTAFTTSLFPKDETYLLPIKAAVRTACALAAGDVIDVDLTIGGG